jgi:hypothetical protein
VYYFAIDVVVAVLPGVERTAPGNNPRPPGRVAR